MGLTLQVLVSITKGGGLVLISDSYVVVRRQVWQTTMLIVVLIAALSNSLGNYYGGMKVYSSTFFNNFTVNIQSGDTGARN